MAGEGGGTGRKGPKVPTGPGSGPGQDLGGRGGFLWLSVRLWVEVSVDVVLWLGPSDSVPVSVGTSVLDYGWGRGGVAGLAAGGVQTLTSPKPAICEGGLWLATSSHEKGEVLVTPL